MADIDLYGIQFETPQAPNTEFPVSVGVENNETVAPLWGAEALCSDGVLAPDGHRVEVTFEVVDQAGNTVESVTVEHCATVEQPSNALGEGRAEARVSVSDPGEYTVTAHGEVSGAGGTGTAQPKYLNVGSGPNSNPAGDEDADNETDGSVNVPDFGDNFDWPDAPDAPSAGGLFDVPTEWTVIAVLFIVVIGLGAVS